MTRSEGSWLASAHCRPDSGEAVLVHGPALDLLQRQVAVGQHDHAVVGGARAARVLGQDAAVDDRAGVRVELDEDVAVDGVEEAVAVGEHHAGVAPLARRAGVGDLGAPALAQRARVDPGHVAALGGGVGAVAVDVELVAVAGHRDVGGGEVGLRLPRRDVRARDGAGRGEDLGAGRVVVLEGRDRAVVRPVAGAGSQRAAGCGRGGGGAGSGGEGGGDEEGEADRGAHRATLGPYWQHVNKSCLV